MTMRWNCSDKGCYLNNMPDWGILDGCFPRRISPTDIDGCVEINGFLLFLEWKRPFAKLLTGQRLLFEAATRHGNITAFVIFGDPLANTVEALQEIHAGKIQDRYPCSLEGLRERCKKWAQWTEEQADGK